MKPYYFLKARPIISFFFFIAMLFFSTGCAQQTKNIKGSTYYLALQTEAIETEISRLESSSESSDGSLFDPKSYFYLALLHSHYKNPEPNYKRALEKLEEYILIEPESEQNNSVQYLLSLLDRLVKNENSCNALKTQITTLKEEKRALQEETVTKLERQKESLTQKYENLVRENQDMKEIIEKLKHLDIQLEKKRKNIQ
ncbi:MAG: hypothetical protein JW786_03780 [Desulfobacterales bacterium]|nr:hypothetical protein [Desulfobacterales bacterium]